jgi:hypothetical protein
MPTIAYDDYVYTLTSLSPVLDPILSVTLPKDLIWTNEMLWSPVAQDVKYSLTGALLIQESVKQKGREIDLSAPDNAAWVSRVVGETLMEMRDTQGLVMTLKFVDRDGPSNVLFEYPVMFRHAAGNALELENIKSFDQYEEDAWYIVRGIKLMVVTDPNA